MTTLEVRGSKGNAVSLWSSGVLPAVSGEASGLWFSLPGRPGVDTDVLGIPRDGLRVRPPVRTDLTLAIDVAAPDCPLGPVGARLVVRGEGLISSSLHSGVESPALDWDLMALEASYVQLLDWLHGTARLGSLLWLGCRGRGDWIGISAIAGIVQAPKDPVPESEVIHALVTLAEEAAGISPHPSA